MQNLDLSGKKVLIRVDFNVPVSDGKVSDDTRIVKALPTIQSVLDKGASVILMSHLGRPQKKKLPDGSIDTQKFTLAPVAAHLEELLGRPVLFAADCAGPDATQKQEG